MTTSPRFTTLDDWLAWQQPLQIKPGLDRVHEVARRLDLLNPACPVVIVGGTNGKGSTVAMLEAVLRAAGLAVGCYTSPHITHYCERIRIDGEPVSETAVCDSFARIDQARDDLTLTYFEFGTLAALDLFTRADVDIQVLEVGLGGRLDAVNIIDADVSLVTTIGLDHIDWLGDTRDKIAREKAGIYRRGRPAICADRDIPPALLATVEEIGAIPRRLGVEFNFEAGAGRWEFWSDRVRIESIPMPALPGTFQLRNASAVIEAVTWLRDRCPIPDSAICAGIAAARLNGRFERHALGAEWVLDVAHNPQAAEALADALAGAPVTGRTFIILGMMDDKDCSSVMQCLDGAATSWHLATLPPPRGTTAARLKAARPAARGARSVFTYDDVAAACRAVHAQAVPGDRVVITGSFVTVDAATRWLQEHIEVAGDGRAA
ncbi:MAG: bifunctional tetrahydrofolate synthase/dihydrofolate synthase [Gammaproteobacteria bacterium]|nr:bifunctional tetrahydrofolate synthase/dihydrofolate synthase [Gammaproteobacteria bacterium]